MPLTQMLLRDLLRDMTQKRKARGNGTGSAYQVTLPDGRVVWRVAETIHNRGSGKVVRVVGQGSTEAMARERLYRNKVKRQVASGQAPPSALALTREERAQTLDDWWTRWIERRQLEPSTTNEYRTRYRLHIAPHLGSRPLRSITVEDVDTLIWTTLPAKKKANGDQLLQDTARRSVYVLLNSILIV